MPLPTRLSLPGGGQSSATTCCNASNPKCRRRPTPPWEQQLASLKAWATDNGIFDLSKPQMDKATEDIAKKAWDAGFAKGTFAANIW